MVSTVDVLTFASVCELSRSALEAALAEEALTDSAAASSCFWRFHSSKDMNRHSSMSSFVILDEFLETEMLVGTWWSIDIEVCEFWVSNSRKVDATSSVTRISTPLVGLVDDGRWKTLQPGPVVQNGYEGVGIKLSGKPVEICDEAMEVIFSMRLVVLGRISFVSMFFR